MLTEHTLHVKEVYMSPVCICSSPTYVKEVYMSPSVRICSVPYVQHPDDLLEAFLLLSFPRFTMGSDCRQKIDSRAVDCMQRAFSALELCYDLCSFHT